MDRDRKDSDSLFRIHFHSGRDAVEAAGATIAAASIALTVSTTFFQRQQQKQQQFPQQHQLKQQQLQQQRMDITRKQEIVND